MSTTRHFLCLALGFNQPLRGSLPAKSFIVNTSEFIKCEICILDLLPVMLQPWRFSAFGILLSLVYIVLGEDAAQHVLSENAKVSNDSLLWGPYRPNLYFGVRPRIPKSLMTGLIWAKVDSFQGVQNSMWSLFWENNPKRLQFGGNWLTERRYRLPAYLRTT